VLGNIYTVGKYLFLLVTAAVVAMLAVFAYQWH
jgi:hypothetical protein